MVNNRSTIPRQQCFQCELADQQPKHHHFERCQWQKSSKASCIYLIYRWAIAAYFLITLLYSIVNTYNGKPSWKWLVYVTHWSYTLCMMQTLLALYIVQRVARNQNAVHCLGRKQKLPRVYRTYWVLQTSAVSLALVVTILYWVLEYKPEKDSISALNLIKHVFNSVMVVIDHTLVAHPVRLLHAVYPIIFAIVYAVFTYIYHLFHGLNLKGNPNIYTVMNWDSPLSTMMFGSIAIFLILLMHLMAWLMFKARSRLARHCIFHSPISSSQLSIQEKPILIEMQKTPIVDFTPLKKV